MLHVTWMRPPSSMKKVTGSLTVTNVLMFLGSLRTYVCESICGYLHSPAREFAIPWECRGEESPRWLSRTSVVDRSGLDVRRLFNTVITLAYCSILEKCF